MRPEPVFVAPSSDWTGVQAIDAFAEREMRPVVRMDDDPNQFTDGERTYRLTIVFVGDGRMRWAVIPEGEP